jgi:endonuclease/exonuclease/phosphatase family metal-dependent hydrolase
MARMTPPPTQRSRIATRASALAALLTTALALSMTAMAATAKIARPGGGPSLRIATWNLEWFIAPENFLALARTCVPRDGSPGSRERYIPCDVAMEKERSALDLRVLERYVDRLDADIVALQEVDGIAAARRVFRNHDFCFTQREGVQNNGFAIRKGVPHRCGPDLLALSLDDRVRRGAELIIYPDEKREFRLLSLHLKSGCARRTLDDPRRDCQTLARQIPELERWIDEQAAAGRRFGLLGDFNHDLLAGEGPTRNDQGQVRNLWAEIDDDQPKGLTLLNVAAGQPFVNCAPDQNYRSYIDHVVLDGRLAEWRVAGSFVRLTYEASDALQRKLSDHCPVGVDLRIPR